MSVVGVLASAGAFAQTPDPRCGNPFVNGYGPLDYRVETGPKLKIVEDNHFTARVESLISGLTSSMGGDIDYTLRAFPNHHRALIAMKRLGERTKQAMPRGAQFTVECYFKRALMFRPDDAVARMLYATFLASDGRKEEALLQVEAAAEGAPDAGFTQYNAGLIFFEMSDMDRALRQAHRALRLGFEREELKQLLQSAGKWIEPSATDAVPTSGAASVDSAASSPPRQ